MISARTAQPSRGMTVVAVLVCLIILTLVAGALLKASVAHRELGRKEERRLQAEWLAESGAQRAIARLARDREYAGETWSVSSHDLGQNERPPAAGSPSKPENAAAQITITVEPVPAAPDHRLVRIRADYPLETAPRNRHTKELMIDFKTRRTGATS